MKQIIIDNLKNIDEPTYLLLSGGVDSTLLAVIMKELGINFLCVTFSPENHDSIDLERAAKTCKNLNLQHEVVRFPTDINSILSYIPKAATLGAKKKTDFECFYPMTYVYRRIQEGTIVSGLGADGLFCMSKHASIHYSDNPYKYATKLFYNPTYCQRHMHKKMGITHRMPFLDLKMLELIRGQSKKSLNTPKEKYMIYESGKDYFEKHEYPKHLNYQKGDSKISESFMQLINTDIGQKISAKDPIKVINYIKNNERLVI